MRYHTRIAQAVATLDECGKPYCGANSLRQRTNATLGPYRKTTVQHTFSVVIPDAIRRGYDIRYTSSIPRILGRANAEPAQTFTVPAEAFRMPLLPL
jgi:hypothetical protein